jgi:preprotein translocase subunit SecE
VVKKDEAAKNDEVAKSQDAGKISNGKANSKAGGSKANNSKADSGKATSNKAEKSDAVKKQQVDTQESQSGFNISEFLKGTKEELDKVVWPSRQQLISESVAVILMVSLSATVIYLVDKFFSWASQQVF